MAELDRELLARDLDRLGRTLATLLGSQLEQVSQDPQALEASLVGIPGLLGTLARRVAPLAASRVREMGATPGAISDRLTPLVSASFSGLLDLSDDELAYLVDVLATELGAIRRVRAPLEPSPELEALLARLGQALT